MPDITMCSTSHCPRAQTCFRAQDTPSERQAWAAFGIVSADKKTVECEYCMPIVSGSSK
jgi:hypothetical protein